MATLILEDGTRRKVEPADPRRGFTLDECYDLLGCTMIERVYSHDGRSLVIDEEGRLHVPPRPVNLAATALYGRDVIVGPALLCTRREFK